MNLSKKQTKLSYNNIEKGVVCNIAKESFRERGDIDWVGMAERISNEIIKSLEAILESSKKG
jgi:hypothetical protein